MLWHDGERVTSRDVAYTVRKVLDPATKASSWVSSFANVASVETPDELTLVVHFTSVYADALEPWRVPLVPEHVASKDTDFLGGAFARHPIGCGPFRFVSHDPGQSVVLEAFDRYWGGRPALDRMIVKIVSAERTAYESLLMGELDLLAVTPDLWRDALTAPAAARLARFVYYSFRTWKIDWNQNQATPYFHDKTGAPRTVARAGSQAFCGDRLRRARAPRRFELPAGIALGRSVDHRNPLRPCGERAAAR